MKSSKPICPGIFRPRICSCQNDAQTMRGRPRIFATGRETRAGPTSGRFKKELGLPDLVLTQNIVHHRVTLDRRGSKKQGSVRTFCFFGAPPFFNAILLFYVPYAVVVIYLTRSSTGRRTLSVGKNWDWASWIGFLGGWKSRLFAILNTSEIGLQDN